MKTFALRIAALVLATAATAPAFAATLFDNLEAAGKAGNVSFQESYPPYYAARRLANRIPVGPGPARIETVTMDVYVFNGLTLQVCDTAPTSNGPDTSRCTTFTPDGTAPGRRVFTGSQDIAGGNVAWIVLRTVGMSTVSSIIADGLAWITNNGGIDWSQMPTTLGMAITGTPMPWNGACGTAALQPRATAPATYLCTAGTASAVQSANGEYTWECAGANGGAAQQCSAPWANAGQGTGTVQTDGAGGWHITSATFTSLPAPLPTGAQATQGPLALVLDGGADGTSAQVTVHYTTPVPAGAVYLKYGPSPEGLGCTGTTACAQPHWYVLPGAQFAPDGLSVTFTLTDGGAGDSDTTPGRITDPGVPVLLAVPPGNAQAIPTLGPWALALLGLLAAAVAGRRLTHRAY